jgi:hypothetical protein
MEEEWTAPILLAVVVLVIGGIWLFGGLAFMGVASPWAERIRTETRQQSQSYIEGTMGDFDELCLKLTTAPQSQKSIYADVITHRAGRVTDDTMSHFNETERQCIKEARAIMTAPVVKPTPREVN